MVDSWLPTVLHARHFVRVITSPFIPPLSTSNAGNLLQGRGGNFKGREGKDWRGTFVSADACHSPFRSETKLKLSSDVVVVSRKLEDERMILFEVREHQIFKLSFLLPLIPPLLSINFS